LGFDRKGCREPVSQSAGPEGRKKEIHFEPKVVQKLSGERELKGHQQVR